MGGGIRNTLFGFPSGPGGGPFFARPVPGMHIGGGGGGGVGGPIMIGNAGELLGALGRLQWHPGRSVLIGSGEQCDICWTSPAIQDEHARITFSGSSYSLLPIDEAEVYRDGTLLRGQCSLAVGTQLQFGPKRGNMMTWDHPHRPSAAGPTAGQHGTVFDFSSTSVVDIGALDRAAALTGAERFREEPPLTGRRGRTEFLSQPHSGVEGGTQQALPVGGATRAPVIDAAQIVVTRHFRADVLATPKDVVTQPVTLQPIGRAEALLIAEGGEGCFATTYAAGITMRAAVGGKKRPILQNEDGLLHLRVYPTDPKQPPIDLYAVADGVGGATKGHVAARLGLVAMANAVNTRYNGGDASTLVPVMMDGMEAGHAAILRERGSGPQMGTTITVAIVQDDWAEYLWAGDSPGFGVEDGTGLFGATLAKGGSTVLTTPHTLVVERAWMETEFDWIQAGWRDNGQTVTTSLGGQFDRERIGRLTHRFGARGGIVGITSDALLLDNVGLGNMRQRLSTKPRAQLDSIVNILTPITRAMQDPRRTLQRITAEGVVAYTGQAKPDNATAIVHRVPPAALRNQHPSGLKDDLLRAILKRFRAIPATLAHPNPTAHPTRFAHGIAAVAQERDMARLPQRLRLMGLVR